VAPRQVAAYLQGTFLFHIESYAFTKKIMDMRALVGPSKDARQVPQNLLRLAIRDAELKTARARLRVREHAHAESVKGNARTARDRNRTMKKDFARGNGIADR